MAAFDPDTQDGFSFFRMLPWAKMVTWGLFLGLVYILSALFPVLFITFVISYICRNFVKLVYTPFGDRWYIRKIIVIFTFLLLLSGLYFGGAFLGPNIVEQGRQVANTVRDLRIHEDMDNALPKLLASIRFRLYKNSDPYDEEFKAFRESEDPVKLSFDTFRKESEELRTRFRDLKIQEYGEEAYQRASLAVDDAEFQKSYRDWKNERIREEEFVPEREKLEATKERELKVGMSDAEFDAYKKDFNSFPGGWSGYLERQIMLDLVREHEENTQKKEDYKARFKETYIEESGRRAIAELEGTEKWKEEFQAYYEGLPKDERTRPFDEFIKLERAKNQLEFIAYLGGEEKVGEEELERIFAKTKIEEFEETFKKYEFLQDTNERLKNQFLPEMTTWVYRIVEYTLSMAFYLILSIFLSFFIVWDIPRLKTMIGKLQTSRIGEFYREVFPGLVSFGWLMGRAFQAQAIIAAVNTTLTFTALYVLEVPHRAFLCSIVFICSFIPVVGVIISSIPICVVALQQPGGILLALEMVGCVLIIHFIETTVLNPKIMGDMLKLHPLLVLVILVVGEHFFGVWGLLLGVPVSVYIFRFVILRDPKGMLPPEIRALQDMETSSEAG